MMDIRQIINRKAVQIKQKEDKLGLDATQSFLLCITVVLTPPPSSSLFSGVIAVLLSILVYTEQV